MITISLVYLLTIFISDTKSATHSHWNYGSEELWKDHGLCGEGSEQSPVNLSPSISHNVNFPPFIFNQFDNKYPALIKNNGHAVEIRIHGNFKPTISGGGLSSTYVLDHLHFHWQSEHTIDDKRFPLELHLVLYNALRSGVTEALKYKGDVTVLSVLFYTSSDDDVLLQPIFQAVNRLYRRNVNDAEQIREIDLNDFLPRDRASFFRYNGSLTTPECTEGIIWTVFSNPLPISYTQVRVFSMLKSDGGDFLTRNYRTIQSLNDRPVFLKSSNLLAGGSSIKVASGALIVAVLVLIFKV